MKKSHLKSVIKAIIKEASMANTFHVVLKGDKSARDMFGRSFVKTGKGKLPVQVSMPDTETTIYTVWDGEVLQTIQTILQGLGWKKEGVQDKDIIWSAPQGAMEEGIHDDWYVKEKGERMRKEKDKKAAAKLLWGWVKSDRQMDFQKFFALLSVLEPWRPISEPTGHKQVYNPKPLTHKGYTYQPTEPPEELE